MNSKEIIDELITEIETIRLTMDTQIRTNENDKSIQYKLLNELKGLLKKYLNSNPPIPGLGERVGDFLLKLDEEAKQFNKIQEYEDTIAKLDKTKGLLQSLSTFVGQNRKALTSALTQSMSEGQALEQLESLKKKRDQVEKELSEIPPKYRNVDVTVTFDEAQQKYESLKKGLDDCRQICEGINVELNTQRSLLKEYSALSKPSTTLTLQEIKSKINKLETIMSRLSEYAKYISFLIEGRPIAEGQEFYGALGEYLAVGLIREIYHNHHTYPIKQINLIERFYVSESGEVIHFDTIGSGTSALNSILMKIKQTDNKKKIIALIDEISAMDDENFKTFLEDVKAYTTDGRLLLTIMTRPDSSVDKAVCEPVKLGDSFDRIRTT
jgi:predicted  nucleic acid-binding Zn-ribbon protein